MHASGIRFVVGRSFARIFARNATNLGVAVITCGPAVDVARRGSTLGLDLEGGSLDVDGRGFSIPAYPPFMLELIRAGGLVE